MSQTNASRKQGAQPSSRKPGRAVKPGQPNPAGRSARLRRTWTAIILAATATVIAATVYVVVWDPLKPPPAPADTDTGPSRGEQVRRKIEELLAAADAIDPRGGDASLAAQRLGYEQAAELGRRFVQLADQRDVLVRPVLAKALLRLGKLDDAEKTINALLKLAPHSAEGFCLKGELLETRRKPGALEYFRRAAESDQATPEIWARYGSALLAARQLDQAQAMFRKAFDAGWKDHQVLWGLAVLAMQAGKFDQAEPPLAELAARARPSTRVLVMLAECQKENARPAEAEKTLRRALEQEGNPGLYILLGDVLQLQRKYADAALTFVTAAEIFAEAGEPRMEAEASFKAARTYYLLDRYGLAMKHIDRAAALVNDPDIRQWQRKIEDARFGRPDALEAPPVLPPSIPSGAADANAARPGTRPAKGLLDFE